MNYWRALAVLITCKLPCRKQQNRLFATIAEKHGSEMTIELVADATLPVGGCRIQYGGTVLEADLGHQWQQITQHYRERGAAANS